MNRIVFIGNGFDLAHELKTSYPHFINWYWEYRVYKSFINELTNISKDPLCTFEIKNPNECWNVFQYYLPKILNRRPGKEVVQEIIEDTSKYNVHFSPFLKNICESIETKGWADIESEYYNLLTKFSIDEPPGKDLKELNEQLAYIQNMLVKYLNIVCQKRIEINESIEEKIYAPINSRDIAIGSSLQNEEHEIENVLFVNFNYTNTADYYLRENISSQIHIHGELSKPESIIFGYGDEMDEKYKMLQNLNNNECLQKIKSIKYLESDNYRNILRFVDSAPFQIYIMGHSCGNSDRTLLNTLFEHRNCISIKPYFYIDDKGKNHYLDVVQNISRNFNDMKLMRDRVVNKMYCEELNKSPK